MCIHTCGVQFNAGVNDAKEFSEEKLTHSGFHLIPFQ